MKRKRLEEGARASFSMKTRRMTKQVLDTSKSNPRTEAVEKANSTTSALLRLPSEVRNRIYELVFGGLTVHVSRNDPKQSTVYFSRYVRSRQWSDVRWDAFARYNTNEEAMCAAYMEIGFGDLPDYSFSNTVRLLKVCKQIHREAALLPYKLNTFVFKQTDDIPPLASRMSADQVHAIRSLDFEIGLPLSVDILSASIIESMQNLEELRLSIELSSSVVKVFTDPASAASTHRNQDGFLGNITCLKLHNLRTVQIVLFAARPWAWEDGTWTPQQIQALKDWGSRAEKKLLQGSLEARKEAEGAE